MSEENETLQAAAGENTAETAVNEETPEMNAPAKNPLIAALQEAFPEQVEEAVVTSNYPTVRVVPAKIAEVMGYIKNELGLDFLSCLTSADYPEDNQIEVVYFLNCISDVTKRLQVKVRVDRNRPDVPTITSVFPGADWQEREEFDLMGVNFTGHPHLVRVLLPDDFQGHPLRKDFKGVKLC